MDSRISTKMTICKNCNNQFEGKFCNQCGQNAHTERFNFSNIAEEFIHGFYHLHSGVFYTIKELSVRPGITITNYLEGKRVNLFNPFTYLVLISIAAGFFHSKSGIIEHININFLSSPELAYFTSKHYSVRMLFSIPIASFTTWILFRNARYNFPEHLILNTYITSQTTILTVAWMIIVSFFKLDDHTFGIILLSAYISIIIFNVFCFVSIFNKGTVLIKYLKAILAVIVSIVLTFILMNFLVHLFEK